MTKNDVKQFVDEIFSQLMDSKVSSICINGITISNFAKQQIAFGEYPLFGKYQVDVECFSFGGIKIVAWKHSILKNRYKDFYTKEFSSGKKQVTIIGH